MNRDISLQMSREEAGIVMDALIHHRAETIKGARVWGTGSEGRIEICERILSEIGRLVAVQPKPETLYLIYSPYHSRSGSVMWWAHDSAGYTTNLNRAGRYTMAEACKALWIAEPCAVGVPATERRDTLVPEEIADRSATEVTVSESALHGALAQMSALKQLEDAIRIDPNLPAKMNALSAEEVKALVRAAAQKQAH